MNKACENWDCQFNQPVDKMRSDRRRKIGDKKKTKHGRRKRIQIAGKCILGSFRADKECPEVNENGK